MSASFSRRAALLGSAFAALHCRASGSSGSPSGAASSVSGASSEPAFGGLEVQQASTLGEHERGGTAIVLLHGYGAPGNDLSGLAKHLLRPGVRCILPAAPLSVEQGGRAWWQIDAVDHPRYVTDEPWPNGVMPPSNPELEVSRLAVSGVLRTVRARYAPERLFLGGFSQGAMLSLDLLLSGLHQLDRVAVLSGAMLIESASHMKTAAGPRAPVFVSHGRRDTRLTFVGAERMREELEAHGYPVTFRPFDGPHAIPPAIISELAAFFAA